MQASVPNMRIALVSAAPTPTTLGLASASPRGIALVPMTPVEALAALGPGDAALGRLDVRPTLDGVQDGLWSLGVLAARGLTVLNDAGALLASHDKLLTARILRRAGLPHPETRVVRRNATLVSLEPPVVVKPRYGSWGQDVARCDDVDQLAAELARVRTQPWYRAHGALVQQLVPPLGHDLRLVVAGGAVVGAVKRVAARGEWRTNVALGARRVPVAPPGDAVALAVDAAMATGGSLVGVDLLPDTAGGWTILEVNGAVEFNEDYGPTIYRDAAAAIAREALERSTTRPPDALLPALV